MPFKLDLMAGRKPNLTETVSLTIATTPGVVRYLQQLVETHLYGKSHAEAAERLIARAIESLIQEGTLRREKTFEDEAQS
jgi:hypothetical protein